MTGHLVLGALWTFNIMVLCPGLDARIRDLRRLHAWLRRAVSN